MVRHIVLLVMVCFGVVHAEERNPLNAMTEMTKITQLSQLKSLFVKDEPRKLESFDEVLARVKTTVVAYIEKHSNKDASKKWNKKFKNRVETRAKDEQLTENEAADELVMEWIIPRRNQTDWDDYEALEICHMFLYYDYKNWALPDRIQDRLKADGGKFIVEILNQ